ncbi:hypothetical protein ACHAO9_006461 [Fusarium lateritium]
MALRLAPYNNGMRLGQGFNSYTQQICVDDAVVTDPDRIDNQVTNDGFTMRDLRFAISGAHTSHSPSSEDSGDTVLVPAAGEEANDSSTLAAKSFAFQFDEVTDEMNISGSLSIKYGAIGGLGKGSFIDSDKFKESDLNFFISVKVINQSINIKDALIYQALPSVDEKNFVEIFGDCFISGFLEGGEFNALVSMKVLNKDKKTEIEAEAKVALTIGPVELEAEAKVKVAKNNIQANTETTIQVGWSGGGSIKPMDEPWSIDTLMQTAARFPDLVAKTPQRT